MVEKLLGRKPPQEQPPQQLLEQWIQAELEPQYEQAAVALNTAGVLEILPHSTELGVIGIDENEYPLPTKDTIITEVRQHPDIYLEKLKAGYGRILPAPTWAVPVDALARILSQRILAHHNEKKLFTHDAQKGSVPLALDTRQPVWTWDGWESDNLNETMVYYPQQFNQQQHGGKTKRELLIQSHKTAFPGWNMLFLPKIISIPQQWKDDKRTNNLKVGKSANEYLNALRTQKAYQHESGMTLEDWMTLFFVELETTNHVIDDYAGTGKACWLLGAYHPGSGCVGFAFWYQYARQAYLFRDDPSSQRGYAGLRPAVRMGTLDL